MYVELSMFQTCPIRPGSHNFRMNDKLNFRNNKTFNLLGYRHIDTAACYGTEKAVGKAVLKAVEQKIVSSREELFITSKLWGTDAHDDLIVPALKKSLENLGLEYLDLYLIHWPVRLRKTEKYFPIEKEDIMVFDMKSTWAGMEECKRLGLVHSIGVSNFSSKKLSDLVDFATIPPAVDQVEMNLFWQQKKLIDFCKEKGILITAYSPLGAHRSVYQGVDILNHPIPIQIAHSNNKTASQICLRWLYEQGVSIAVKSYNEERMKENLQIFDWKLSEADRSLIANIPQKKGVYGDMLVFPNGVYKSIEQIWDGEI
ncbi:Non-functional NADPH-dependent codeinone reductase 2 [Zostera marina]|uniref:Non-functional NADPH-dependent codeinone reductase 2 n=1 Tax=Zostera marina TaxID=29655 RepID=A0A0K9P2Q5_ZOSMR|nr:Non-functional NADPH-dependent codeinone reductase 2 [Zostera marina]